MRLAAIIAMSLGLAGCCCFMFQGDPYYSKYTRVKPDEKHLVGVYAIDGKSLDLARRWGADLTTSTIELKGDGAYVMKDVPLLAMGTDRKQLTNESGTWTVDKHQEWWVVSTQCEYTNEKGQRATAFGGFNLIGEKPPYVIHFTLGDPDSGDCVEFERQ